MTALETFDPLFGAQPRSEDEEIRRLVRALELTEGFALILCRAHPSQFPRLMEQVEQALSGKRVQHVLCDTPHRSLLSVLAKEVSSPPPDAVFVSGIERWFRAELAVRSLDAISARFLFNMNAQRNDFPSYVPCPLVLWIPDYILRAIQRYAPDFFSVHSVLLRFPPPVDFPDAPLDQAHRAVDGLEWSSMLSLSPDERDARIDELIQALNELRTLPNPEQNRLLEARLLDRLAVVYQGQGRYTDAEPRFRDALAIRQSALSEGHPDVATSLNNLAILYQSQGRYAEAELLYDQALRMSCIALPEDHTDIAATINNLAALYEHQGRFAEADTLYHEALKIYRVTLPEGHPDIAIGLNNLAELYRNQGRYAEAEPLYHQALQISRVALPENHPDSAIRFNNLALLYESQGRYAEAEPLFDQALRISRIALPEGHPKIASRLNNLAGLYVSQARYAEAKPLYDEALTIYRAALPTGHPDIAMSLNNLAGLYKRQGDFTEAALLYNEALHMAEQAFGAEHPNTRIVAENLLSLLRDQETGS